MYSRNLLLEKLQLALLDGVVVFAAALAAVWIRHAVFALDGAGGYLPWAEYLFPAVITSAIFVFLLRSEGLYSRQLRRLQEARRIIHAASAATLTVLALTFFYRGYSYSRATALLFHPLSVIGLVTARYFFRVYRKALLGHPAAARRVLIVGFGSVGQHLGRVLLEQPSYYKLVGFLDDDPLKSDGMLEDVRVLGGTSDLERVLRAHHVDEVVLAVPSAPQERLMDLLGDCLRLRVRWKLVPNLCDLMLDRMHLDQVGGVPLIGLRGSRVVGFNWGLKRAFDLTVASTALVLFSPLLGLIALAVKLTSHGPVLHTQTRIGLGGRPFSLLKFRSMHATSGTEIHRRFTTDWIYGRTGGAAGRSVGAAVVDAPVPLSIHKMTRDPRVTRVGGWLRLTSLDELPQLWNVARGNMSIVGPRPPLPYEVERYSEWHKRRLEVLPGITGLWQVSGRNALSFEEMVRLDIQYIENWSLEEDLRILLKTLPVVLFGKAY